MAGKKVNRLIVPNIYSVNGVEPVTSVNGILPVNGDVTIPIPTVPTNVSAFTNDAGYLTSATLAGYATQSWVQQQGYLTSIPSQYITDSELSTTLADYVTSSSLSTTLNSYATITSLSTETSDRRDADDSLQLQINDKYDASNPSGFISGISGTDVKAALGYEPYNSSNPDGYITSADLSGYARITDIPIVGNGTITITQGGVQKGTFTTNQFGNTTINLDAVSSVNSVNGQTGAVVLTASDVGALPDSTTIPTKTSDLTNDSGFITNSALTPYALSSSLATVATSGSYSDLSNKPTIPAAQIQSDWSQTDSTAVDFIKNKPIIPSGVVIDQTYDGTSTNAQSGVAIQSELSTNYQSKLVSGTNIKTVNNTSLLGSGNIAVQPTLVSGTNIKTVNNTSLLGSGNINTSEIFVAEYGVTSFADILDAYNSGKTIFVKSNTTPTRIYHNVLKFSNKAFYFCTISDDGTSGIYYYVTCTSDGWSEFYKGILDTDFSNLSPTGQAIIDGKVSKSGDTMSGELDFVFPELDLTTTLSTNVYKGITLKDTNGNRIGRLEVAQRTDGSYGTMLSTKKYGGNDEYNTFNIGYNSSNQPFISVPNLNGAFHAVAFHLAEAVSVNGSTGVNYSLANYLPDDDYYYYVWVLAYGSGDATSGHTNNVTVSSSIFGSSSVCRSINRTSASTLSSGTTVIPIGTDRILNLNRSANWYGTATLYLRGYQRIGING